MKVIAIERLDKTDQVEVLFDCEDGLRIRQKISLEIWERDREYALSFLRDGAKLIAEWVAVDRNLEMQRRKA